MISLYDESKGFFYENGFYLTSENYRMGNIIAHYELYKKIINLPGDVIELGVFKGASLIQFCAFREMLENENSRKIVGFDTFGKFPEVVTIESDRKFVEKWNCRFEDEALSMEELYKSLEYKKVNNVQLVKGNIINTVENYLREYPHTRISLLHIDVDVYEATRKGFDLLFDRVVRGGVVVFDDYAVVEGESIAVEECLKNREYIIKKFPFSHTKPSYIIKK